MRYHIADGTVNLHATCTVNALNVTRIGSIVDFFTSLGSKLHVSFVQYPLVMDPANLPDWQKLKIIVECNDIIKRIDDLDYKHWRFNDKKYLNSVKRAAISVAVRNALSVYRKPWCSSKRDFSPLRIL